MKVLLGEYLSSRLLPFLLDVHPNLELLLDSHVELQTAFASGIACVELGR